MTLFYYSTIHGGRLAFSLYFRWRYYNAGRVPPTGPVILASNHISYIDPFLIGCALDREICYLCRESAFHWPILGSLLPKWNAVPVDRDAGGPRGMLAILDRLEKGNGIVLFPEGTRTSDGQLQPARAGIGLLAVKSKVPVVPVRLFGMYEAYNRHKAIPRPRHAAVKFGRPLDLQHFYKEAETCSRARLKEIYQMVADEIMRGIARLEPCADKNVFP